MASYSFKIVILGDGSIGKTSLINRFVHGKFESNYIATIGTQISKYEANIDEDSVSLVFWDLAGQSGFEKLRQNFFGGSDAAIIVFSHEENEKGDKSLQAVLKWYQDIVKNRGRIPIVLFGNKIDLVDKVQLATHDEIPNSDNNINKFSSGLGLLGYYKTSALTGEGVIDAFKTLTSTLIQREKEKKQRKGYN